MGFLLERVGNKVCKWERILIKARKRNRRKNRRAAERGEWKELVRNLTRKKEGYGAALLKN